MGTWPETQECALTRNRTSDLLVSRLAFNPLSHTSQGYFYLFKIDLRERESHLSLVDSCALTRIEPATEAYGDDGLTS